MCTPEILSIAAVWYNAGHAVSFIPEGCNTIAARFVADPAGIIIIRESGIVVEPVANTMTVSVVLPVSVRESNVLPRTAA